MKRKFLTCILIVAMMVAYMPSEAFASIKTQSAHKVSVNLKWHSVEDATRYVIYGNKKSAINKLKKIATVKQSDNPKYLVKKIKGKKLEAKTKYVFKVVAYDDTKRIAETDTLASTTKTSGTKKITSTLSAPLTGTSEQVTVDFYSEGSVVKTYTFTKGATISESDRKLPTLADTPSKKFVGWCDDASLGDTIGSLPDHFDTSMTYYAKWSNVSVATYTINYYIENPMFASPWVPVKRLIFTDTYGKTISLSPAETYAEDEHYIFDTNNKNNKLSGINDGNLSLSVYYGAKTYTITFKENPKLVPNGDETTFTKEIKYGQMLTLPGVGKGDLSSFSNPGYKFVMWNTDVEGGQTNYKEGSSSIFDKNTELYAQWEGVPYYVDFYVSGKKVGEQQLQYDSDETLTKFEDISGANAPTGYGFKSWTGKKDSGQAVEYEDGQNNKFNLTKTEGQHIRLDATFKANDNANYTVEYYREKVSSPGSYDKVETQTHNGKVGDTVEAEQFDENAESYSGSDYKYYTLEQTKGKLSGVVVPEGTLVLKVYYKLIKADYKYRCYVEDTNGTYQLHHEVPVNGAAIGQIDGNTVHQELAFNGFSLDTVKTPTTKFNVARDGSTVYNAYYKRNTHTIKYSGRVAGTNTTQEKVDSINVTFPADTTAKYEQTVSLGTPTIPAGYEFDGWETSDSGVTIENNKITSMPNKDITLKAKIKAGTYKVIYDIDMYTNFHHIPEVVAAAKAKGVDVSYYDNHFDELFPAQTFTFGAGSVPKKLEWTGDVYSSIGWFPYIGDEAELVENEDLATEWPKIEQQMLQKGMTSIRLETATSEIGYPSKFKVGNENAKLTYKDESGKSDSTSTNEINFSISTTNGYIWTEESAHCDEKFGSIVAEPTNSNFEFVNWTTTINDKEVVASTDKELTMDDIRRLDTKNYTSGDISNTVIYGRTYVANFKEKTYTVHYVFDKEKYPNAPKYEDDVVSFEDTNFRPKKLAYEINGYTNDGWNYLNAAKEEKKIPNYKCSLSYPLWDDIVAEMKEYGITEISLTPYYYETNLTLMFRVQFGHEGYGTMKMQDGTTAQQFDYVTFSDINGIIATGNCRDCVFEGMTAVATAPGYEFDKWTDGDGNTVTTNETLTIDDLRDEEGVAHGSLLYANFKKCSCVIHYEFDKTEYPNAPKYADDVFEYDDDNFYPKQNNYDLPGRLYSGWRFSNHVNGYTISIENQYLNKNWNNEIRPYIEDNNIKEITLSAWMPERSEWMVFKGGEQGTVKLSVYKGGNTYTHNKGYGEMEVSIGVIEGSIDSYVVCSNPDSYLTDYLGNTFNKVVAMPNEGYKVNKWVAEVDGKEVTVATGAELKFQDMLRDEDGCLKKLVYYPKYGKADVACTIHYIFYDKLVGNKYEFPVDIPQGTDSITLPKYYDVGTPLTDELGISRTDYQKIVKDYGSCDIVSWKRLSSNDVNSEVTRTYKIMEGVSSYNTNIVQFNEDSDIYLLTELDKTYVYFGISHPKGLTTNNLDVGYSVDKTNEHWYVKELLTGSLLKFSDTDYVKNENTMNGHSYYGEEGMYVVGYYEDYLYNKTYHAKGTTMRVPENTSHGNPVKRYFMAKGAWKVNGRILAKMNNGDSYYVGSIEGPSTGYKFYNSTGIDITSDYEVDTAYDDYSYALSDEFCNNAFYYSYNGQDQSLYRNYLVVQTDTGTPDGKAKLYGPSTFYGSTYKERTIQTYLYEEEDLYVFNEIAEGPEYMELVKYMNSLVPSLCADKNSVLGHYMQNYANDNEGWYIPCEAEFQCIICHDKISKLGIPGNAKIWSITDNDTDSLTTTYYDAATDDPEAVAPGNTAKLNFLYLKVF